MRLSRDRLVLAALVLSESAWLYAIFGVIGLALDLGGSPLSWVAVLALLGLSLVVGVVAPSNIRAVEVVYLVRSLVGAVVVYAVIGAQVAPGALSMDLGWLATLTSGDAPSAYSVKAVLGIVLGASLWWRGGRLAGAEFPTENLALSFRMGMIALAIGVMVDVAHPVSLNTFPIVFIFFAAGLGGLSAGHLWPQSQESAGAGMWPRVIAGVVVSVLLVGGGASLLQKGPLSLIGLPILNALYTVARLVFLAVVIPVTYVWSVLMAALLGIFNRPIPAEVGQQGFTQFSTTTAQVLAAAAEEAEEEAASFYAVMEVMAWMFVVVLVAAILYVLGKQLRRMSMGRVRQSADKRESVIEDSSIGRDLRRLLASLIPDLGSLGRRRSAFAVPDGPPGVVGAIRLYYDIITMAEVQGVRRRPHSTPLEHLPSLEEIFPVELVRRATDGFNHAFYGRHATPMDELVEMRATLKGLKWEEPVGG